MARIGDEIFFEMELIFLVRLENTDIFRGAFLLCSGGDLNEVRVRKNGRRIATFLITGKNLDQLDRNKIPGSKLAKYPGQSLNSELAFTYIISNDS